MKQSAGVVSACTALATFVFLSLSFHHESSVSACKCIAPDRNVLHSFCLSNYAFTFKVLSLDANLTDDNRRSYWIQELVILKGRRSAKSKRKLITPKESAACGLELDVGQSYVLYHDHDLEKEELRVNSCSNLQKGSELTRTELVFLTFGRNCN